MVHRLTRTKRVLKWTSVARVLVAEAGSKPNLAGRLLVQFDNEVVRNLSAATIRIANAGNQTIHDSDLNTGMQHQLRITVDGGNSILSSTIREVSNKASAPTVVASPLDGAAMVSFRYLDPGDSFLVDAIYTDGSGSGPKLLGTVRGTRVEATGSRNERTERWLDRVYMILGSILECWITRLADG